MALRNNHPSNGMENVRIKVNIEIPFDSSPVRFSPISFILRIMMTTAEMGEEVSLLSPHQITRPCQSQRRFFGVLRGFCIHSLDAWLLLLC